MWKTIVVVMFIISSIIAITIYSTTLPDTQKQIEDNTAAIEQIESAVENIPSKDIYFVINGNYTSGAPTYYSTELHYFINNNVDNIEDLKEYLKYNSVFLAYYVTTVNDEKVINYRESVPAGGGTYTTYQLQTSYLYNPLKLFSDANLLVGNSVNQITNITFYGI